MMAPTFRRVESFRGRGKRGRRYDDGSEYTKSFMSFFFLRTQSRSSVDDDEATSSDGVIHITTEDAFDCEETAVAIDHGEATVREPIMTLDLIQYLWSDDIADEKESGRSQEEHIYKKELAGRAKLIALSIFVIALHRIRARGQQCLPVSLTQEEKEEDIVDADALFNYQSDEGEEVVVKKSEKVPMKKKKKKKKLIKKNKKSLSLPEEPPLQPRDSLKERQQSETLNSGSNRTTIRAGDENLPPVVYSAVEKKGGHKKSYCWICATVDTTMQNTPILEAEHHNEEENNRLIEVRQSLQHSKSAPAAVPDESSQAFEALTTEKTFERSDTSPPTKKKGFMLFPSTVAPQKNNVASQSSDEELDHSLLSTDLSTSTRRRRFTELGSIVTDNLVLRRKSDAEQPLDCDWNLLVSLMPIPAHGDLRVCFHRHLDTLVRRGNGFSVDEQGRSLLWIAVSRKDVNATRHILDTIYTYYEKDPKSFLEWTHLIDNVKHLEAEELAHSFECHEIAMIIVSKQQRAKQKITQMSNRISDDFGQQLSGFKLAKIQNPVFVAAGRTASAVTDACHATKSKFEHTKAQLRGEERVIPRVHSRIIRARERRGRLSHIQNINMNHSKLNRVFQTMPSFRQEKRSTPF